MENIVNKEKERIYLREIELFLNILNIVILLVYKFWVNYKLRIFIKKECFWLLVIKYGVVIFNIMENSKKIYFFWFYLEESLVSRRGVLK